MARMRRKPDLPTKLSVVSGRLFILQKKWKGDRAMLGYELRGLVQTVDRPPSGGPSGRLAPILPGQFDYVRGQSCFVVRCLRDLALRGAMLAKSPAGAPFGYA